MRNLWRKKNNLCKSLDFIFTAKGAKDAKDFKVKILCVLRGLIFPTELKA
jgi:hypothetical protein